MRIAFLIRSLTYGGAERQMSLLAAGLLQAGHKVSVHVFYPGGEFESFLTNAGVPVEVIGKSGTWESWGFLRRATASIRRYSPEIVHGYMGGGNIVSALLQRKVGSAKVVWGIRDAKVDFRQSTFATRISVWLERILSTRTDLIIANSESGRSACLTRRFPADRIQVIPNGVDLDWFNRDAEARMTWRAAHGYSPAEIVVGRVGRLHPIKDYPRFLEAAALVAKAMPTVKFVCIGSGPESYLQELRGLSERLGLGEKVRWTGAIPNMREAYNGLDLLVSSSVSEGFPNVILEAMACGVPCVTTDAGDAAQIVGGTGIVVPIGNEKALAEGMLKAIQNPPDPPAVREIVTQNYSFSLMVERSERLLQSLIADSQSAATLAPSQ